MARSLAVCTLLVGTTWIFPGRPFRWYASALSLMVTEVLMWGVARLDTKPAARSGGLGRRDYHRGFGGLERVGNAA